MPFVFKEVDGLGFYEVSGWDGARGLFTTRKGGVSRGPYDSLNLGPGGGDDPALVAKNRALLAGVLDLGGRAIHTVNQVHGSDVYVLTDPDAGRPLKGYDAVVTNVRGAAVGVLTADCVPVLLYDPVVGAVAAVHAGWAGTINGVAGKAVEALVSAYGTSPSDLKAAVGPSIGPCCYEVDETVMGPLRDSLRGWTDLAEQSGQDKWLLDLWETNRRVLFLAGLRPENIVVMGLCTKCNPDKFYSHRGSGGKAGRMMAVAMLR